LTHKNHLYLNDTGKKQNSTLQHNEQIVHTFTKIIHLFQRTVQFVLYLCCWIFTVEIRDILGPEIYFFWND